MAPIGRGQLLEPNSCVTSEYFGGIVPELKSIDSIYGRRQSPQSKSKNHTEA